MAQCSILMLGFLKEVMSVLILRSRTFFFPLVRELDDVDLASDNRLASDFAASGAELSLETGESFAAASSSDGTHAASFDASFQTSSDPSFGVSFLTLPEDSTPDEVGGRGKLARSGVLTSVMPRSGADA